MDNNKARVTINVEVDGLSISEEEFQNRWQTLKPEFDSIVSKMTKGETPYSVTINATPSL